MVLARVAGAAGRRQGHFVVPGAEVSGQRRRLAGSAQRCSLRVDRTQARHPCAARPACWPSARTAAPSAELVGEENRGLEYMFIMMNAARYSVGIEGVGLSERAYQTALAYARERIQGTEAGIRGGRSRAHRPPSRRAPHAAAHEVADRGHARARRRGRGLVGRGAPAPATPRSASAIRPSPI